MNSKKSEMRRKKEILIGISELDADMKKRTLKVELILNLVILGFGDTSNG